MLRDVVLRLRSLLRPHVVEQELDEELHFHLEQQTAVLERQGLSPEEARRRARLELGGLDQIREEHRDARGIGAAGWLGLIGRDLRHGGRQLLRAPGPSALAVLCLGLAIGVNSAMFGVLDSVLFRPLPAHEPERVIVVTRGDEATFSYPAYREFLERSRTLSGLTASLPSESDLEVDGESRFVAAETVSASYAHVIGVPLALGRWFADDVEPAAVISYAVWQRHFRLSPDALGRRIRSESQSYTIVGVAAREFGGIFAPFRTDIWVPLRTRPSMAAQLDDRTRRRLMLFGRLAGGVTAAQASAELDAIAAQSRAEQGALPEAAAPIVADPVRGVAGPGNRNRTRMVATLMAAVVGLVLLIACVDVGHLLLVRGAARQRELAVRRALGATRRRILQQLLTESLILAVAGGACGVLLAHGTIVLLERSLPMLAGSFPMQLNLALNWRVVLFATIVSFVATILCGLLPAWRSSAADGLSAFKGDVAAGRRRHRPVGLVAQVTMSFVLLLVAGTFVQALVRMQSADPGFAVDGRLYAYTFVSTPGVTPAAARRIHERAVAQVQVLPGVRTASLTYALPLMPGTSADCVSRPDGPRLQVTTGAVDPGYFDTMAIAVVRGRRFAASDDQGAAAVVVVNERLAQAVWPTSSPIGDTVLIGCNAPTPATVVGVARNSAIRSPGETPRPHLYLPFAQHYAGGLTAIVLETRVPPATMIEPVRRTLLGLDPGLRVYAVEPLGAHVDQSLAIVRWQTLVLTGFGLLALVLAATGLYGVTAYRVALRTREIGVRMALGANRRHVFREVVGHGISIALVGVAIGGAMAVVLGRAFGSLDADIRPPGFIVLATAGLAWIAVSFLATALPAARASGVNPLIALRYE